MSRCTAFPGTGPSGMNVHRICLPLRGQRRPCERSSRTCFPFNPVPRYRAPRTQCRRSGTGAHDTTGATEGPNRRAGWVPRAEVRRGFPPRPGGRRSEDSRDPTIAEVLSVQRLRSRPVVAPTGRRGFSGSELARDAARKILQRWAAARSRASSLPQESRAPQLRRGFPALRSGQRKPHIRSMSISASMQSASRSRLASRSACRSSGCAASRPAQASSAAQAWGASNRPCR